MSIRLGKASLFCAYNSSSKYNFTIKLMRKKFYRSCLAINFINSKYYPQHISPSGSLCYFKVVKYAIKLYFHNMSLLFELPLIYTQTKIEGQKDASCCLTLPKENYVLSTSASTLSCFVHTMQHLCRILHSCKNL